MFRQTASKLKLPLSTVTRACRVRNCSYQKKGPEPLCAHHKDLVPPFTEVGKLKSFELKSDCTTFHMKSTGYDGEVKNKYPCPDKSPCGDKKKSPCPEESPCGDKKK